MKQFVRYLYEYDHDRPIRNVGFVKVQAEADRTVLHIHGRGLRLGDERKLGLYLFLAEEAVPVCIYQGEIENVNPAVNYRLIYTAEDTGVPENYDRIQGMLLASERGRCYGAAWDDMPVQMSRMRIWQEVPIPETVTEELVHRAVEETEPESVEAQIEEEAEAESAEAQGGEEAEPELAEVQDGEEAEPEPAEAQDAEGAEPEPEEVQAVEETEPDEPERYITPSVTVIRKIQRQEIATLPRCEWRVANNSFLLHGYYNYHYLIFLEEGEQLWLGVPGIYHRREAKAADAYGFSRFVQADQEEQDSGEIFGYWCRKVRQMRNKRGM